MVTAGHKGEGDTGTHPEMLGVVGDQSAGNRQTFEAFYRAEYGRIVGLSYALCGSTGMAEDIAQEALLAMFDRWDQVTDPVAWIRRVVANRSVSIFRRRANEAKVLARLRSQPTANAELLVRDAELWTQVRQLPKRQAQVVALHYVDDASVAEIADLLQLSENTIKTHLKRAKLALNRVQTSTNAEDKNA